MFSAKKGMNKSKVTNRDIREGTIGIYSKR